MNILNKQGLSDIEFLSRYRYLAFKIHSEAHTFTLKLHCVTFLVEGLSDTFLHGDVITLSGMFHSMILNLSIVTETKPDQVTGQICGEATPLTVTMSVFCGYFFIKPPVIE
ncbi:hypothetical protein NL108_016133 [Boleophthalmus pectinirostris]|nr:hypothetical protein NL108_016133 [Boleophthalmus pectinirostris]